MFCRNGPGANVAGGEPAPLIGELVVIIPVLRRSPQPCADCLSLFPASSFAVERYILVVEPHVVKIDVSVRQKSEGVDCISGPETVAMIRRVVKVARCVQDFSESKEINSPVTLHPGKTSAIEGAPDIAAVTRRDEILRAECGLLPASSQRQIVFSGFPKSQVKEALMHVHLSLIQVPPRPSIPSVFKAAGKFTKETETLPQVKICVQEVALHQVRISGGVV